MTIASPGLRAWHDYMHAPSPEALAAMIADDAVFFSPVVHRAQQGKALVMAYLGAAARVLGTQNFAYQDEIVASDGRKAMLEFTCEIEGIHINGVDIIHWNEAGQIISFKVMIRPLKAINMVWKAMGAELERMQQGR